MKVYLDGFVRFRDKHGRFHVLAWAEGNVYRINIRTQTAKLLKRDIYPKGQMVNTALLNDIVYWSTRDTALQAFNGWRFYEVPKPLGIRPADIRFNFNPSSL